MHVAVTRLTRLRACFGGLGALIAVAVGCYEIVPIEPGGASSSDGTGGATTTSTSSAASTSTTSSTSSATSTASSTSVSTGSIIPYAPVASCRATKSYFGTCTDGNLVVHWREASAEQEACDNMDDPPPAGMGFCAISFCANACDTMPCTGGLNAACWADSPIPDPQPCTAVNVVDACQRGLAIADNLNDGSDCLIRDCLDEGRVCTMLAGAAVCVDRS